MIPQVNIRRFEVAWFLKVKVFYARETVWMCDELGGKRKVVHAEQLGHLYNTEKVR
jgi:hypothetical protein